LAINNQSNYTSQKEEIKQIIIDKISKRYVPNFTDEERVLPA